MELNGAKILYTIHTDIPLLGDLKITQTLVTTWIVMALLSGLAIWLGSNLKLENVSKSGRPQPSSSWSGWISSCTTTWGITLTSISPDRLDLRSEHRLQPHQCHWPVEPHGRPEH